MDEILKEIKAIAQKYKEINKVMLFGSRARGDNSERSDYDIAIFTKNNKFENWFKFYNDMDEINTLFKFDIVHVNKETDAKLLDNICNEGVEIMSNKTKVENYINAANRLCEAIDECSQNPTSLNRDGVIQRFEFSAELAWKACREYLMDMGYSEINGPKPVMKEAFSYGLINDSEAWINILNDRNLTSHIYKEETAIEIYNRIKDVHIKSFKELSEVFKGL